MRRLAVILTVLLSAIAATAFPWSLPERPDTAIWFVNIYPGAEIFQLEGHSAIAVQIPGKPVKPTTTAFSTSTRPTSSAASSWAGPTMSP